MIIHQKQDKLENGLLQSMKVQIGNKIIVVMENGSLKTWKKIQNIQEPGKQKTILNDQITPNMCIFNHKLTNINDWSRVEYLP